jgi:hypothetical protein
MGFAGTVSNPPIHIADVVTRLVMAQFIKIQAAPTQSRPFSAA